MKPPNCDKKSNKTIKIKKVKQKYENKTTTKHLKDVFNIGSQESKQIIYNGSVLFENGIQMQVIFSFSMRFSVYKTSQVHSNRFSSEKCMYNS